jgi:hypothetical protein
MPGKYATLHSRVHLAGVIILVVGWLAALAVYITQGDAPDASGGYQIVNGQAFATPFDSKSAEMQQLERLGGKASVWTYRFDQWLASLWHGQRLAYTLAILSSIIALLCIRVSDLMADEISRET